MNKASHRWRSVTGWILVAWIVAAPAPATNTSNTTSSTAITTTSSLPQVSSGLSKVGTLAQAYASLAGSCFNMPMPAAITNPNSLMMGQSMGQSMGMSGGMSQSCPPFATVTNINSSCPGSDQVPNFSNLSCATMSPMAIQQARAMLHSAFCTIQCEQGKVEAIKAELQCLQNLSSSMTPLASQLTAAFQNAVIPAQQQIMAFHQAQQDNQTKLDYIQQILNGTGASGSQGGSGGLLAMKKKLQDQLAAMPQTLLQEQNDYKQYVQNQNNLQSMIQSRTAGLMGQCFSQQPNPAYRCSPTGPQVSPAAYVVCRYQQNRLVGSNGLIEQNNLIQNQADAGSQSLSALLDQMGSYIANNPNIPSNGGDLANGNTSNAMMINSPGDVDTHYGAQLAKYTIGNQNARDFVLASMENCYARGVNQVTAEKSNPGSSIGIQLNNLQTQKNTVSAELTLHYQKVSQLYSDSMGALSGQNLPLNAPSCASGVPQAQLNCLQNVQKELQGLLVGTAPDSKMVLQIRGSNPAAFQTVNCSGLNGCITALQNGQKNIQAAQSSISAQQKQYVLNQNQQMLSFTKQQGQMLSMQSTMMNQQLQSLNNAIATLGGQPVQIPRVQGESLKNDSTTGLYNPPNNALNAVAQFVAPPLPDFANANFGAGAGAAMQNVSSKAARVAEQMVQIENLLPACEMERNQSILQQVTSQTASACYEDQFCQEGPNHLMNDVNAIALKMGMNANLMGSFSQLRSGVITACEDPLEGRINSRLAADPHLKNYTPSQLQRAKSKIRNDLTANEPSFAAPRGCQAFKASIVGLKSFVGAGSDQTSGPHHSGFGR